MYIIPQWTGYNAYLNINVMANFALIPDRARLFTASNVYVKDGSVGPHPSGGFNLELRGKLSALLVTRS